MRYVLAASSMLVLACFGEAPVGPTSADDSTSVGSSTTASSSSTMTAADSSTVDTSAQTSSTVDTSDDDGPTSGGPGCEMGTVPTPPKPPGRWDGPGYMIAGDEPPAACPEQLGSGPRALLGDFGNACDCACEGEFLEICELAFESGANCTKGGLDMGGVVEDVCTNLPGAANAIDVSTLDSTCTPIARPPSAEEIQLCAAPRDVAECFPIRDDMRGPCFWSFEARGCPPELDAFMAREAECGDCQACDHAEYCDSREWTPFALAGCQGDEVATPVTDANCHLNFTELARSIRVQPSGPPPACPPAKLALTDLTVCCVPE